MRFSFLLVLTILGFSATAQAESSAQYARRLREYAQFDIARAGEFRKLAGEDEGVVRAREAQAADLDNNARNYEGRASYHRQIAASFGNNPDQMRLASEAEAMARDLHNMANERRSVARMLMGHVGQMRGWAQSFEARARATLATAANLENSGRL